MSSWPGVSARAKLYGLRANFESGNTSFAIQLIDWFRAVRERGLYIQKAMPMTQAGTIRENISVVGARNGLELAILRDQQKGVGKVILSPGSPDLIAGVAVEPLQLFPDDRGFFSELARLGSSGLAAQMIPGDERRIQVSMTLTYPGAIKAIHYHYEQTDLWAPIAGMLQVFLCDLRRNSPSFGAINTLFVGTVRPWKILIPPGVGHGYKVLGTEPAQLVYFTDRYYNPADEGRLPYNHPDIAYDWETQHK